VYKDIENITPDPSPKERGVACHDNRQDVTDVHGKPIITLIGQPNSGKTTLFNALTNSNYKTSNYPGATVEYSVGKLLSKYHFDSIVVDSPGIVSLTPSSPDEEVTINALFYHPEFGLPDVVIVTTDSTQLSRQLFLVKQLIDAGFNVVTALTMNDLLERKNLWINTDEMEKLLGCPVIKINATKGSGISELVEDAVRTFNVNRINGAKAEIHRPKEPTEASIIELYNFIENVETKVIQPKERIDIQSINRRVFNNISRKPDERSVRLDKIFLHPVWGMVIFVVSMGLIFTSIFWLATPLMDLIDSGFGLMAEGAASILPENTWYNDLISNGIIGGVGSVAVFLPQIIILFLFLGILEDTGYLARSAMLVDKPLSKFGLNGRSFVPMLSGYACAIPAIMAARTIPNRKERLLTIMIIPLMSCSARLPVYALLLAFVTPPDKPWIAGLGLGALYFFSLVSGSTVAGIISKVTKAKGKSTFMLELPAYRKPVLKHIIKNTYYKSGMYIKKAGPAIVFISLILWVLTYFPNTSPPLSSQLTSGKTNQEVMRLEESERLNTSYSATLGKILEPILKPLGWDWRIGVSLISAFAAREVFVSAMAITMSVTEDPDQNIQNSLLNSMRHAKLGLTDKPLFTTASTVALIIYFMFAMQCLSTVVVSRKETGSWRIPLMQIVLYTIMAYVMAFVVYSGLKMIGIG
jgi:ferrous iron transport protein B